MSILRPEMRSTTGPCVTNGTAYLMILSAVEIQAGLIHGKLHAHGAHCAIGSYFAINRTALPMDLIDEVAAVNDSVPHLSEPSRKRHVLRWLKWKCQTLGMSLPGRKVRSALVT